MILFFLYCNTSFAASIEMKCARHYIFYVDIDRGTLTQDIFFAKKKGSSELEKKETLEEFIYRRGKEMRLADVNNAGVASLFKKRLKY